MEQTIKNMIVYKKAYSLAMDIFKETKNFPSEEKYALTNQIRRSSRSIGAQIAEAWGKRKYKKHFILLLTGASAEINETEHWLDMAFKCNYMTLQTRNDLVKLCQRIHGLVGGIISKADQFCQN